jgi:hypothetical protein
MHLIILFHYFNNNNNNNNNNKTPELSIVPIIRVRRIGEQPMTEVICFSEMPVLTRITRHIIPEDGILHSQSSVHLKSHI